MVFRGTFLDVDEQKLKKKVYNLTYKFSWLLHSDPEFGIVSFASEMQIKIAVKCQIFVMDATFSITPIGFQQVFTVHGLYSKEKNDNGEWVPLSWCLMEKRFWKLNKLCL